MQMRTAAATATVATTALVARPNGNMIDCTHNTFAGTGAAAAAVAVDVAVAMFAVCVSPSMSACRVSCACATDCTSSHPHSGPSAPRDCDVHRHALVESSGLQAWVEQHTFIDYFVGVCVCVRVRCR